MGKNLRWKLIAAIFFVASVGVILILTAREENVQREFGQTLLVAGLVALIYEFLWRSDFTEEFLTHVAFGKQGRLYHEFGLRDLHESLPPTVRTALESAKQRVIILTTWIPAFEEYMKPLRKSTEKRNLEIHILMLDPSSSTLQQRWDESWENVESLGSDRPPDFVGKARQWVTSGTVHSKLTVSTYQLLPSLCIFLIDDKAYISFYLHGKQSISQPQLELHSSESVLWNMIREELWRVWKVSKNEICANGGDKSKFFNECEKRFGN